MDQAVQLVVVGQADKLRKELAGFGEVRVTDLKRVDQGERRGRGQVHALGLPPGARVAPLTRRAGRAERFLASVVQTPRRAG